MATTFPKVEKLKRLIESKIAEKKALLKEGEQLDAKALEDELVAAVTKAMTANKPKQPQREMTFEELIDHTEKVQSTAGQLRKLRETMTVLDQSAQQSRESALAEYADLYETCARRYGIDTKGKGWQEQVTKKLREAKLLQ